MSRAVENFLSYDVELLTLILRARLETLRSSEMVRLDTVLKHGTMEELIRVLADRPVNQLSYPGMREAVAFLAAFSLDVLVVVGHPFEAMPDLALQD